MLDGSREEMHHVELASTDGKPTTGLNSNPDHCLSDLEDIL